MMDFITAEGSIDVHIILILLICIVLLIVALILVLFSSIFCIFYYHYKNTNSFLGQKLRKLFRQNSKEADTEYYSDSMQENETYNNQAVNVTSTVNDKIQQNEFEAYLSSTNFMPIPNPEAADHDSGNVKENETYNYQAVNVTSTINDRMQQNEAYQSSIRTNFMLLPNPEADDHDSDETYNYMIVNVPSTINDRMQQNEAYLSSTNFMSLPNPEAEYGHDSDSMEENETYNYQTVNVTFTVNDKMQQNEAYYSSANFVTIPNSEAEYDHDSNSMEENETYNYQPVNVPSTINDRMQQNEAYQSSANFTPNPVYVSMSVQDLQENVAYGTQQTLEARD